MPSNHHCLNASVPQHLYGYVCSEILHGLDPAYVGQYEPCVIFGVTSIPSRALHFSILCESGAQWARIPLHMLRWELPSNQSLYPLHNLSDLQCWDCHGWDFSVTKYEYLQDMACQYRKPDKTLVDAYYWFTLDHTDNGFSQYPPEHKCYHLLKLEDGSGQIAAMPNNRILWRDKSWVKPGHPLDYAVMSPDTWHAEEGAVNPQDTAITRDAFQIEEGKHYLTASGRVVGPVRLIEGSRRLYAAPGSEELWTRDGKAFMGTDSLVDALDEEDGA